MKFLTAFLLVVIAHQAHAWGERGHHTIGYAAALATQTALNTTKDNDEHAKIGNYFLERTIQLGHLNNIPDISWKDPHRPNVIKLNPPSHAFDSEVLLGPAKSGFDKKYLEQIRHLEPDLKKLAEQYEGKPNPLPGAKFKNISLYFDSGTAPWRAQGLFDEMVAAFKCAAGKPTVKIVRAEFRDPLPDFKCNDKITRAEAIYAATVFGGIMGHFVGDMSNPHHVSADFDGYVTGQGGIHSYFETFVVLQMDQTLLAQISRRAAEKIENKKIWQKLGADPSNKNFAVQTILNLAADSLSHFSELQKIDRHYALIKESEKIALGAPRGQVPAERKPYTDKAVIAKFAPIIKDRLTTAAIVLSHLWVEAWRQGGSPDLSDIGLVALPYPMDVPFLPPTYAGELIKSRD